MIDDEIREGIVPVFTGCQPKKCNHFMPFKKYQAHERMKEIESGERRVKKMEEGIDDGFLFHNEKGE